MFQILLTCYFCFYFTFTVYTNVRNTAVFMVRKGKKKAIKKFKSQPLRLLKFLVFSNPPTIPTFPPTISFWYFFQPPLLFHIPQLLETLEKVVVFVNYFIQLISVHSLWYHSHRLADFGDHRPTKSLSSKRFLCIVCQIHFNAIIMQSRFHW